MSTATFSSSPARRYAAPRFNSASWIRGVCAEVAERAGVAVWIPRVVFIVFGLLHWFLAVVLYVVLVKVLAPARQRLRERFADPAPLQAGYGSVKDRFSSLDARLAELEAASLNQEASLRRQFRDLDRG